MPTLTYYGHACFLVETGTNAILIDPFLSGNPRATIGPDEARADHIIVTHGHGDHLGDAVPIARRTGATVIANFEIAAWCERQGVKAHPLHIGGGAAFPFGRVKLTPALHGSSFPDGSYAGNPAGALITAGGRSLYHAGDTGLFSDMTLIGDAGLDVAILPIGDNFTMGIDDALLAAEFLRPKMVVPMHYDTFEIIHADVAAFRDRLKREKRIDAAVLIPGASLEF